ncbi:MAG: glycerophosphodiester phosphodiesterase [Sphingobacteriaceae bacterium]|nr:MAG: glycerophosphodiester phosphodiesterase [Sphingobacteriaceae bacterium]
MCITLRLSATILTVCMLTVFCNQSKAQTKLLLQAHRGGRGLMPENTIPAMKNGLDFGADLEMDIYLTRDQKIVVSHEDHIPSAISLTATGDTISKTDEANLGLTRMDYSEIQKYDVGTKYNPAFPQKKSIKVNMPLLINLIDSVEAYAKQKHYKLPNYNIEAKLPKGKNLVAGYREAVLEKMVDVINKKGIKNRVIIQSFDVQMLEMMYRKYPEFTLSYLVKAGDAEKNLANLSFKPVFYSPDYHLVNKATIDLCHKRSIKVIPWTVDTVAEMKALKTLSVDGIISDYPNMFKELN